MLNKVEKKKMEEMGEAIFFEFFFRIEIIKCDERRIGNYLRDVAEQNRCSSKHIDTTFSNLFYKIVERWTDRTSLDPRPHSLLCSSCFA